MTGQLYYTVNFKLAIGNMQLAIFLLYDSIFANWSMQTANFYTPLILNLHDTNTF
jgi:hypothetical protein